MDGVLGRIDTGGFFAAASEPMCVLDTRGRLLAVNPAWTQALGWSGREAEGARVVDLAHPGDRAAIEAALAALARGDAVSGLSARCRRREGGFRWLDWGALRAGPDGLIRAVVRDARSQPRRRTLERLSEVAARTTNLVVVCDARRRIEWVNPAFERVTGWSLREARGRSPGTLLRCPETDPATIEQLRTALDRGEAIRVEIQNAARDGRRYWTDLDIQPVRDEEGALDGFVSVQTDITERRAAAEALRESEARFRSLFEALPDGVMLVNGETLAVEDCNEAGARMFGWTRETITGLTMPQVEATLDADEVRALHAHVRAEGRSDFETRMRRTDGETFPAAVTVLALEGGDGVRFLGVLRDISDHHAQRAAIEQARRSAEAASAAKSQFLAMMSHEVRTPLNGVLGMAEALDRRLVDPEALRMVSVIRDSGEALLTVLNDILDLSKIEAGRLVLEAAPFDPVEAARRVAALHRPLAEEKGLTLRLATSPDAAARREGDAHRFMQILHNLVSNAVKFTPRGGVAVTISVDGDRALRLVVEDTGVGMSPAETAQAFDPFSQADSSTTRRFGGTGLGMSIVRRLGRLMGGDATLASTPGVGTVVTVVLPLPEAAPEAAPETGGGADAPGPIVAPPPMRVLAADDNEINRMVLEQMLAGLGVTCDMVDGGRAAAAMAAERRYDALLLDIAMPDMDGIETLAAIRAQEAGRGAAPAPAIAATANAFPHQIAAYRAAGFAAHISKPLSTASLAAALRSVAPA